jgi:hypothetical protein
LDRTGKDEEANLPLKNSCIPQSPEAMNNAHKLTSFRCGILNVFAWCAGAVPFKELVPAVHATSRKVILAEFEDFTTLQFILTNARWAGAPTQKQMLKKYLRERMRAAVRRLPHSEDVLAEVLEKSSRKWRAVNERV